MLLRIVCLADLSEYMAYKSAMYNICENSCARVVAMGGLEPPTPAL